MCGYASVVMMIIVSWCKVKSVLREGGDFSAVVVVVVAPTDSSNSSLYFFFVSLSISF